MPRFSRSVSFALPYLAFITVVWAVSFNLIGVVLAGKVDSDFAVLVRVALAALIFLPFLRWRGVPNRLRIGTMAAGALQFGVTYLCLYRSFSYLSVAEVLLFTIFTPIYITLIDDCFNRHFSLRAFAAALLAVFGSWIIRHDAISQDYITGFLILQLANFTFALGQVGYKHLVLRSANPLPQYRIFGYFFLGALLVALPSFLIFGNAARLPTTGVQWATLAWMGLMASALGFYLWNKGACMVDAGTLGTMNNMHIPIGLLLNLLVWNRDENLLRLALGGAIIALAVWFSRRGKRVLPG